MSTVNKKEIEKFSKMAAEWWDPSGKFKPLHKFNPIRIKYIKENIINSFKLKAKQRPLEKINILDIGCGGGLLSEPMTRLGANVTGIDASSKNISIAKLHAKKNKLKINYLCSSPEKLKIKKKFDVILNMEIVEHVEDINFFINSCSKLLKKNGLMFVATLNKTLKSYIFAIVGAEYVLRWLPIGTHDWEKFVRPEDLKKILSKNNLKLEKLEGMNFNIIKDEWTVSSDTSINYIVKSIKTLIIFVLYPRYHLSIDAFFFKFHKIFLGSISIDTFRFFFRIVVNRSCFIGKIFTNKLKIFFNKFLITFNCFFYIIVLI
jgi:2-polyprenyl-6-hydroxyphenyl methylase/3-demethylubiquinone-9 3-methyltransferase